MLICILIGNIFGCDNNFISNYNPSNNGDNNANILKIHSGGYGFDVAYRIDGNKIYSGNYGFDVAYRVDGN
jgi:hypothetical protein